MIPSRAAVVARIALSPRARRPMFDALEGRRMFCGLHSAGQEPEFGKPVELRPDLVALQGHLGRAVSDANDPADIVWVNRGTATSDSDGFTARFGAAAPAARAVADAVIVTYERMIGSFNYVYAGQSYSLTVNMGTAGSGFGASAGLQQTLADKPIAGAITMGAGSGSTPNGTGNGWFLDPTPFESSEFQGSIVNAFTGNAQSGSPAAGKGDFYTVFAAELTHCMGLFGNASTLWSSHTTASTTPDTAEGGGVGKFYTFTGPSIQHLLTSNNAGPSGSDFNQAIHSAGPITTTIGGVVYNGAQDQGNASYEQSRRYIVNNAFALMFKDAYSYSTVNPAKFGTFYSNLNETTGQALVRGGQSAGSADTITVTRAGSKITVSVDIGVDIGGTGALPGPGNLPAFVTEYDVSQLAGGINIQSGDGDDTIVLGTDLGVSVLVDGGTGTDTLRLNGSAGNDALAYAGTSAAAGTTDVGAIGNVEALAFDGGAGLDTLTLTGTAASDAFTVAPGTFSGTRAGTFANLETLAVNALGGADTVTVNAPQLNVVVDAGGGGADVINVVETAPGYVVRSTQTANVSSLTINVNGDGTGAATFDTGAGGTDVGTLGVKPGGTVSGSGALTVSNTLTFSGGTIGGAGALNLPAGSTLTANGPDPKTLARVVNGQSSVNVTAGTLTLAAGLSSASPAAVIGALTVAAGAALDVTDNALVIDYDASSPIGSIGGLLRAGYNAGAWTGPGINSSAAAAGGGNTTLGYAEASAIFTAFPAAFAGAAVDATSVLIRYTAAGDADLNRTVDFSDLLALAQHYGTTGQGFAQGDFNYSSDGTIDFDDLLILAQHYGASLLALQSAAAVVPVAASPTPAAKRSRAVTTDVLR